MGKGSSKTNNEKNKDRNFYTFTLNNKDPRDLELIEFLKERPTTASVKEGLRLLMENTKQTGNKSENNQDVIQALALALSQQNNLSEFFSRLNQNSTQINNEHSASIENKLIDYKKQKQESKPEYTEEDNKKIKIGERKAQSALANLNF